MIELTTYGYSGAPDDSVARVTAVHKERYELVCVHGACTGVLKTGAYYGGTFREFPTVGDFVRLEYQPGGDSLILDTLPRRSYFSRLDPTPGRGEQAVAANFDWVFLMQSLNHDFNPRRLERYLTLAWQSGGSPVVLLTKADLCPDHSAQRREIEAVAPGVPILAVSVYDGAGLEGLTPYLSPGKTAVFLGSSGVGKSSLLNALWGETVMAVKSIREDDSRGRHTTTHRQLFLLAGGAMVIDTPGMRSLGMWDVTEGLGQSFADVEAVLARPCRFTDCRHKNEPGCAVRAALESGELSPQRWQSYESLRHEARFSDDKSGALREKYARNKAIAMQIKQLKKKKY